MKLQVCWQQMGCLRLAISGKEQKVYMVAVYFRLFWTSNVDTTFAILHLAPNESQAPDLCQ